MICDYCNGTGTEYDSVRGVSFDCSACSASGRATCVSCGDDAEITTDDGDYSCGDCWQETCMEKDYRG